MANVSFLLLHLSPGHAPRVYKMFSSQWTSHPCCSGGMWQSCDWAARNCLLQLPWALWARFRSPRSRHSVNTDYFLLMHTQRLRRTEVTLLNHREPSVLLFARKHFVSSELLLWEKQTIRWVRRGELQLRPNSSSPTLQFSTVLPDQSIRTGASEHSTQGGSWERSTRQDPTSEAREVAGHTFSGPCDPFLPLTSYVNFRKWH